MIYFEIGIIILLFQKSIFVLLPLHGSSLTNKMSFAYYNYDNKLRKGVFKITKINNY